MTASGAIAPGDSPSATPRTRACSSARRRSKTCAATQLRILTVAVPGEGDAALSCVDAESAGVADLFARRVTRPSPASVENVLAALDECEVWHFACHGEHDPDQPLASCLLLEDGPLSLRALFARPTGRTRLAVLAACETAIPDGTLVDEVVNFPSALLQCGVGGAVCSQTLVDDAAAMLLVLALLRGRPPRCRAPARARRSAGVAARSHQPRDQHRVPGRLSRARGLRRRAG